MDLSSIKTIKELLGKHEMKPSKGLGQNFLIDKRAVGQIIEAIGLQPDDTVLEIGPGPGVLTQELAKTARKVIAIEKDDDMVEILKETLKDFENVEIIHGDIRRFDLLSNLSGGRTSQILKVVGNLPFYLTAPVIRQFLETMEVQPQYMVFVVQKEVAQRICAKPPDMNLLAVSVQFYAEPKIISYISKKSFWPSPEVDAAIMKITPYESRTVLDSLNKDLFFKIVRAGFSQPRKQLINNLSNGLETSKKETEKWLLANDIRPSQRAETLSVENWVSLTETFMVK